MSVSAPINPSFIITNTDMYACLSGFLLYFSLAVASAR